LNSSIVILTGSGISKESGLDTFRDADGIWAKVGLEDVATPEAFARNPVRVHEFYNTRRRQLISGQVVPNAAHAALAALEARYAGQVLIVTQNIDNLHERAGSRNIIHMHGEILKARCGNCDWVGNWCGNMSVNDPCPDCGKTRALRPHVVWFGELPLAMDRIAQALAHCGLFMAIGTSGAVYPAAGFVAEIRGRAHTVELNLEPSLVRSHFAEAIYGKATEIVPAFVDRILKEW